MILGVKLTLHHAMQWAPWNVNLKSINQTNSLKKSSDLKDLINPTKLQHLFNLSSGEIRCLLIFVSTVVF